MSFYHFYPCPLLSSAPLNKLKLDTCCFNNLDDMVLLAIRCQKASRTGEFLPVTVCLYLYAIEFKSK